MRVEITWHGDNFNVDLSNGDKEAFLSIKGCRIVEGNDGPFVSYPAKKNENTGKWWNHVWGSAEFNTVVLAKAMQNRPSAGGQSRQRQQRETPF